MGVDDQAAREWASASAIMMVTYFIQNSPLLEG